LSSIPPPECVTTTGMQAGQVVGAWAHDNHNLVVEAQRGLVKMLHKLMAAINPQDGSSLQTVEDIRSTPVKVWHERGLIAGPDGGLVASGREAMGFKFCVAIPDDAPACVKAVIDGLPSHHEGFQVWAEPWSQAPGRETF
jgi:hypothetical protein